MSSWKLHFITLFGGSAYSVGITDTLYINNNTYSFLKPNLRWVSWRTAVMYAAHVSRSRRRDRSTRPRKYTVSVGPSQRSRRPIPLKVYFNFWMWYGTRAFSLRTGREKVSDDSTHSYLSLSQKVTFHENGLSSYFYTYTEESKRLKAFIYF